MLWLANSFAFAVSANSHPYSTWRIVLSLILRVILPLAIFFILIASKANPTAMFGTVKYIQIQSSRYIERIRELYRSEADELAALGFVEVFCFGEGFSIFRLFLIFPAIVMISMMRKGEALTLQGGYVVNGNPVFGARDSSALVSVSRLGTKFYTAFQDGTLLISKTYTIDMGDRPGIIDCAREASIGDIWAEHQRQTQALETEGKRIDRQNSFQFYSELSRRDKPVR
jgi:hypothetical protein